MPVTRDTRDAIRKLADALANAGCIVEERNPDGFSYDDAWAVARGSAKGVRATVADYMVSLTRRDQLIATLERFFDRWDALICPVTVSPAIGHVPFGTPIDVDEHRVPYFIAGTAYTCPFNLTGHPAVVLPLARSRDGLPIGVQLAAKRWAEPALLALAQKVALVTGPFTPPPNYKA